MKYNHKEFCKANKTCNSEAQSNSNVEKKLCSESLQHTNSGEGRKKVAFTLAEVLITLTILGVVASLLLFGVYKKFQRTIALTRFKESYALLNNAIRISESINGQAEGWNWCLNGVNMANTYILPYLDFKDLQIDFSNNKSTNIRGIGGEKNEVTKTTNWRLNNDTETRWISLKNGMDVAIIKGLHSVHNRGLQFWVDTNGINKGSDTVGKDIFIYTLRISASDGNTCTKVKSNVRAVFEPGPNVYISSNTSAALTKSINDAMTDSKWGCKKTATGDNGSPSGSYCSYVIYKNGFKIPDGYPGL